MVAKRSLFLIGLLLPMVLWAAQPESIKLRQLIGRSMERVPGYNVIAVVLYRALDGSDSEQAKVEIARDGRMHRVVLQPLSREGFESVDDGKSLKTLVPDHKTILIQESPLLGTSDVPLRLSLVDRNYSLRLESPTRVAGREAISILAIPRHGDLMARRLVLDAQTGFLLRLEVASPEGKMEARVEVKSVDFPNSLPPSLFQLRTLEDTRIIQFKPREELNPDGPLDPEIHFKPVVPRHLPYGFMVQGAQVNRGRFHSIAVRVTDGLVRGTVYESLPSDAPEMKMDGATRLSVGSVTFTIIMDAPEGVRQKIVQIFAKGVKADNPVADGEPGAIAPSAGTGREVRRVKTKVFAPPVNADRTVSGG